MAVQGQQAMEDLGRFVKSKEQGKTGRCNLRCEHNHLAKKKKKKKAH